MLRGLRAAPAGARLLVALSAFAGSGGRAAPPARLAAWAERTGHFLGPCVFLGGRFCFRGGLGAFLP